MGKVTIEKSCIRVLKIYNPLNNLNKPEQLPNENNEGTKIVVQETARHALLRDDKSLITGDFNCKKIDWEYIDSHKDRESWIHKFLVYRKRSHE